MADVFDRVKRLPPPTQMALAVVGLQLLTLLFREIIPFHGGLGGDGYHWAHWGIDWSAERFATKTTSFRILRMLPYVGLRYVIIALGLPLDAGSYIGAFTVINVAAVAGAVYFWGRSAVRLQVPIRSAWLGGLVLCGGYFLLKFTPYYPVLSDRLALLGGSVLLWAHLEDRWAVLLMTGVLGAVTWPTLAIFCAVLLVFPPKASGDGSEGVKWGWIGAALAGVIVFAVTYWAVHNPRRGHPVRPLIEAALLSAAVSGGFVVLALRRLLGATQLRRGLWPPRWVMSWRPAVAIALVIGPGLIAGALAARPSTHTLREYVEAVFHFGGMQPGVFLVAHVMFYGPVLVLVPGLWSSMAAGIRAQGTGLILCFVISAVQAVDSESRHLSHFLPFFALFFAQATAARRVSRGLIITLVVLSILFSRVWLTMNIDGGPYAWRYHYRATQGPWMSHGWYAVQGAVVLITWLALSFYWLRARQGADASDG